MVIRLASLPLLALLLAGPALAQTEAAPPPQWPVTCYGEGPTQSCEAAQPVILPGSPDPVAQAALGWLSPDAPLMLTVVVPPDISLSSPLGLRVDGGGTVILPWNRCRPAGCFAGADLSETQLAVLRKAEAKGSLQLSFNDGSEAAVLLRLPLAGLGAALDALAAARPN